MLQAALRRILSPRTRFAWLRQYRTPIVVGGIGGSGTRLIAQLMKDMNYYMGNDLNAAQDNLWFTLLFKRHETYRSRGALFDACLETFLTTMTGHRVLNTSQQELVHKVACEHRDQHFLDWLQLRAQTLLANRVAIDANTNWGWKEPNSHLYLDRLAQRLPNLKYIHVMRNGLDMAFSQNQNQFKLWGHIFLGDTFPITPANSLKYWCHVQQRITRIGQNLGDRFLLLNYDEFCNQPERGLKKLLHFLEHDISDRQFSKLCERVVPPESIGRFRHANLNQFDPRDVAYVAELGFATGR